MKYFPKGITGKMSPMKWFKKEKRNEMVTKLRKGGVPHLVLVPPPQRSLTRSSTPVRGSGQQWSKGVRWSPLVSQTCLAETFLGPISIGHLRSKWCTHSLGKTPAQWLTPRVLSQPTVPGCTPRLQAHTAVPSTEEKRYQPVWGCPWPGNGLGRMTSPRLHR